MQLIHLLQSMVCLESVSFSFVVEQVHSQQVDIFVGVFINLSNLVVR